MHLAFDVKFDGHGKGTSTAAARLGVQEFRGLGVTLSEYRLLAYRGAVGNPLEEKN
jgi:hypothetical protein